MDGAETEKACRVSSVHVLGTTSLGASVDRSERVLSAAANPDTTASTSSVPCRLGATPALATSDLSGNILETY